MSNYTLIKIYIFIIILFNETLCSEFKVYWNVPTDRCFNYDVIFNISKFNIIQNTDDVFRGDHINIIYRPGMFPYYEDDDPIWGGIPQNGDLVQHILRFQKQVETQVPHSFNGSIVLDFENYEPDFDVSPNIYREKSLEWVRKVHPDWPEEKLERMARTTFNELSRFYFEVLLDMGKELRPDALWGYYHYPYCKNPHPNEPTCSKDEIEINEHIPWMYKKSGALYPSVYIYKEDFDPVSRGLQVQERLYNAIRMRNSEFQPIFPYFWFKYHDSIDEFIGPMDLWSTIGVIWKMDMNGMIIWGSYDDVASEKKCRLLKAYVEDSLGPVVKFVTEVQH